MYVCPLNLKIAVSLQNMETEDLTGLIVKITEI
jgi:hypothetical protein